MMFSHSVLVGPEQVVFHATIDRTLCPGRTNLRWRHSKFAQNNVVRFENVHRLNPRIVPPLKRRDFSCLPVSCRLYFWLERRTEAPTPLYPSSLSPLHPSSYTLWFQFPLQAISVFAPSCTDHFLVVSTSAELWMCSPGFEKPIAHAYYVSKQRKTVCPLPNYLRFGGNGFW